MRPLYVRLPSHLGDLILALPALDALQAARYALWLEGPITPPWLLERLPGARLWPADRRPQGLPALLLKPSFSAAWRARGCGPRVGFAEDLRGPLLSAAPPPVGEHRVNAYLRLAAVLGAAPQGRLPRLPTRAMAPQPSDDNSVSGADLLILVGSATGRTVDWPGARALADALGRLGRRAVFVPPLGAEAKTAALAGPHPLALGADGRAPSVPEVAALGVAAGAVLGQDSGLSHVVAAARRAAGRPVGRLIGLLGATDAARTAPPGGTWLRGGPLPCAPCLRRRCAVAATGTPPCLDISHQRLLPTIVRALDAAAAAG